MCECVPVCVLVFVRARVHADRYLREGRMVNRGCDVREKGFVHGIDDRLECLEWGKHTIMAYN